MDGIPLNEIDSVQIEVEIFITAISAELLKPDPYDWDHYEKFAKAYRRFHEGFESWRDDCDYCKYKKAVRHFCETLYKAENCLFDLMMKTPHRVW